MMAIKFGSN